MELLLRRDLVPSSLALFHSTHLAEFGHRLRKLVTLLNKLLNIDRNVCIQFAYSLVLQLHLPSRRTLAARFVLGLFDVI